MDRYLLVLLLLFSVFSCSSSEDSSSSTPPAPGLEILTGDDFHRLISADLNGTFKLEADITISSTQLITGNFRGELNGQGKVITLGSAGDTSIPEPIFKETQSASIHDISVKLAHPITGTGAVGAIAGYAVNSSFYNLSLISNTSEPISITSSCSELPSIGVCGIGGIVGTIYSFDGVQFTNLKNVLVENIKVSSTSPATNVGGIVGAIVLASSNPNDDDLQLVSSSFSNGEVSGEANVGGLVGSISSMKDELVDDWPRIAIQNSSTKSSKILASGAAVLGGLVGTISCNGDINKFCGTTTEVSNSSVNTSSFASVDAASSEIIGGVIGKFISNGGTFFNNVSVDATITYLRASTPANTLGAGGLVGAVNMASLDDTPFPASAFFLIANSSATLKLDASTDQTGVSSILSHFYSNTTIPLECLTDPTKCVLQTGEEIFVNVVGTMTDMGGTTLDGLPMLEKNNLQDFADNCKVENCFGANQNTLVHREIDLTSHMKNLLILREEFLQKASTKK